MSISVLTIVKGRAGALNNLIKGLAANTILADELVIVFMNEPERNLPDTPFIIKQFSFSHREDLPLAAARNFAAKNAAGDRLIFLDVDCIPSSLLVETYLNNFQVGFLVNGEVRYLQNGFDRHADWFSELEASSEPDPIRFGMTTLPHELFWSLNFGCFAEDYRKIEGFDERFAGYGAEDTDFAFTAREQAVGMKLIAAVAYHQYHEQYKPPLNHFDDIVRNAKVFFKKWKKWPMEGWLKSFVNLGLITWDNDQLRILRKPNQQEILKARKV